MAKRGAAGGFVSGRDGDPLERFLAKIEFSGEGWAALAECWLWTGATRGGGRHWDNGGPYGNFWLDGRNVYPHRFAYEVVRGPIPDDFVLDHLCGVRLCANPFHVEAVEVAENARRATDVRFWNNLPAPEGDDETLGGFF